MTQIIIPISIDSPFFPKEDYYFPKPLVSVNNKPLIIKVIENLKNHINPSKFIVIMPESLELDYSLGTAIELVCDSKVNIILRKNNTSGALCSTLLAIDHIDEKEDIVISNMDDLIDYNLREILVEFQKEESDAGLISFESSHPRWSYIKTTQDNKVYMNVEKRVISKLASAGFYYFKTKELLVKNAKEVMLDDNTVNGLFYLSSVINQLILKGNKVTHKTIPSNKYHSLYCPESIKEYEDSLNNQYENNHTFQENKINILIPAAGKGTRFSKLDWKSPKPFIEINNKPMLNHVINNVYIKNSSLIVILKKEHIKNYDISSLTDINYELISLDKTTEGTASTVLTAHRHINNKNPLLIANSDQIVDFSSEEFVKDCISRNLDGSILVFKDKDRDPKWSFVKTNKDGLVSEVAEKRAISDLATVGIYFFRKGNDFCNAAIDMIVDNERINGEFYTCPIYNYMIRRGSKIGVFEIDPLSMHGLGTPEDLKKYIDIKSYRISKDDPSYKN